MWIVRRLLFSAGLRGHYGLLCRTTGSLPEVKPRYLQCTCCWRSRITIAGFDALNGTLSSELCSDDKKSLDTLYTPEQRAVILQLLNNAAESELATIKLLRGRKSVNILDYRSRHGPFKTLESVINVPLVKHKSAVIVFNSILNPPEKKEKRKTKIQLARFTRPEIDRGVLEDANSIVSIICGTNKVAWTHMDRAFTVLDWQQQECNSFMKGTYMASSYLDDIASVVSLIPAADFFIVEKPGISAQNTSLFPVMAHLRTVEAMLFALLAQRHEVGDSPRVLNMMRLAVGRHFGLIVGESRTSGAQVVRQMMTESVTKKASRVTFPHDLLVKYRNAFQMGSRNRGEEMCDALLQAVAFYELLGD
ncbi:transcription elongation factor, mitochondrial [Clupea harengus]|uniref:Transcription elongation factor, mitochondrial n=1 Tax=Clupea harengus TaxID=7950 RepID=A0A6P3VKQ0_CLUHA|nr:transcription elongation factor, mitochondrial [Clupea harengus]